jgi:hypothetical protein
MKRLNAIDAICMPSMFISGLFEEFPDGDFGQDYDPVEYASSFIVI